MICAVSREYFQVIYNRLEITVKEFGESFYNPFIPKVIEELEAKGLIKEDSTTTKKGVKVEEEKK
jgi:arginyl-tRNA synthetase